MSTRCTRAAPPAYVSRLGELLPVQVRYRGDHMGGFGAHLAARRHQPVSGQPLQQRVQHHLGRPPAATRARNSLKIESSNPGSGRSRPSAYFQSIRVRTASAACRSVRSSASWKIVTKAQAARRPAWLAAHLVGARELLIGQPCTKLAAHHHRQRVRAFAPVHRRDGRDDLRRGLRPRPRLDRHHGPHPAAGTRGKSAAARSCRTQDRKRTRHATRTQIPPWSCRLRGCAG